MTQQVNAEQIISSLLNQIAVLSQEKAMLQVQLEAVVKSNEKGEEDNGSESV